MIWPSERVVAAALGCRMAEVIRTSGGPGRGIRSSDPEVFLIVVGPGKAIAFCGRCKDSREELPPPPTSCGLNGRGEPLFAPGTQAHALHALTWLHGYSRKHEACG